METIDLSKAPRVSQPEAKRLLEDGKALFVDLRHDYQYDMFHLPGAIRLELKDVLKHGRSAPKDKTLVYYCDCANEETSARAVILLADRAQITNAVAMTGTVEDWINRDYPFERTEYPAEAEVS